MRTWCLSVGSAIAILVCAESAQAGVYSTIEPKWELSGDYFRKFQELSLTKLKQLASPEAKSEWQKTYHLAATGLLVAKDPPPRGQPDTLTVEQRLNLGACLLRIREPGKQMPEKAIAILNAALNSEKDNFLVMSTLATANQMTGDYQRASDWLGEAWRYWNKPFEKLNPKQQEFVKESLKWNEQDFAWFAKCEKYQRQLVRLRFRELKKGPLTFSKATERLDPLFDPDPRPADYKPLQFVGGSGKFEAGKIAAVEKAKIPADAIEIVEQLLVWMPDDMRLFWLLGELFNAKGDVDSAKIVFEEFLGKYSQMEKAQRRGKVKREELLAMFVEDHPEVGQRVMALDSYVPPPPPDLAIGTKDSVPPSVTPKASKPPVEIAPLNVHWQTLGIGLGTGALAGFLAAWRLRDLLRRRQLRTAMHAGQNLTAPTNMPTERR